MAEPPQNPDPTPPPPPTTTATTTKPTTVTRFRRPPIRVTTEFDSERRLLSQKLSCKVLDGLAKLRLSFNNDFSVAPAVVSAPEIAFLTKQLAVVWDLTSRNALLKGAFQLADSLRLRASHNLKEKKGELAVIAKVGDSPYNVELSSLVPPVGLPRATVIFPNGEVSVEEKITDNSEKILSVNGIVKSKLLDGVCTAVYKDNEMNLRYCYKDEELTFIPSIHLPSNALSFSFKRRFSPLNKLSYRYHFATNYWSMIYKRNVDEDLKFKAGYDSDTRLGWASLWVGDEDGKTKTAPMKMKLQFMLQVPQDNINNSVFMFRVKKRWDL